MVTTQIEQSFCQKVVDTAGNRRDKVAMVLIDGKESDQVTFGSMLSQIRSIAYRLTLEHVSFGDRVAILGFTSIDYTTVDMALLRLGAVSVPLQTSAPVAQLRPIAAETEPVVIASSIDFLDDAVELMLTGHLPERLVVFDYHAEVDDHREALAAAIDRLAETPIVVETLADALVRGNTLPTPPAFDGIGMMPNPNRRKNQRPNRSASRRYLRSRNYGKRSLLTRRGWWS